MILIMCAGRATRFNGATKQLLPIGKECIVCRIIRQLRERGEWPVMVTHHVELKKLATSHNISFTEPRNHNTLVKSIQSTGYLWDDVTVILLGDVIYSDAVMDRILSCDETMFFGDPWEVYALVITRRDWEVIDKGIEETGGTGRLGNLYNTLCGNEPGTPRVGMEDAPCWENVLDWTRDVDNAEEYQNALRELVGGGTLVKET